MSMRKGVVLAAIVLLVMFFLFSDLRHLLTLEMLQANRQALVGYYDRHPALVVALFMGGYILQTALALPGAAIFSMAAGAIFGVVMGTLYAVTAATIGAVLSFLATRYLIRDLVLKCFGARMAVINGELERRGVNYLLFLRLVPLFPFFLVNLAAGITGMSLRTFVIGTLVGIIPGGFVYVNAGSALSGIRSLADIVSARTLAGFVLLGVFALVPAIYSALQRKDT